MQSAIQNFLDPPQGADEIGRIAHFRVLKMLGRGGMGMVFQAEDTQLQRAVALKVMLPEVAAVPEAAARFLREARATASIKQDNVVTIYESGDDRGVPFLAMELLAGVSLRDWLAQGNIAGVGQIVEIGRGIALGLAAAHARGIIHRDIKPSNVWLEAPEGKVKILDFGLARASQNDSGYTNTNAILGTPQYMSPEQAGGLALDQRSDLFSLGCILYQLAARRPPFQGRTPVAVLTAIVLETPPPVSEFHRELPAGLVTLITRLLEKDPNDRPSTANEVRKALEAEKRALIDEGYPISFESLSMEMPLTPAPETTVSTTRPDGLPTRQPRRSRRWLAAAVAFSLAALVFTAIPFAASLLRGKEWIYANLDDESGAWKVYAEGKPRWECAPLAKESSAVQVLRLALAGGEPYSNAHFYRNLAGTGSDQEKRFTLSLRFRFSPTTYNNRGGLSSIQAIEFTANEWRRGRRSEFALQWLNVGYQAPCWRYWDPHHPEDRWRNLSIAAPLAAERWHELRLEGLAKRDVIRYESFTIDGQTHELGFEVAVAAESGQEDRVAVGLQLDGNSRQDSYDLQVDDLLLNIRE